MIRSYHVHRQIGDVVLIDTRFIPETVNLSQKDLKRIKRNSRGFDFVRLSGGMQNFWMFIWTVCIGNAIAAIMCFASTSNVGITPNDHMHLITASEICASLFGVALFIVMAVHLRFAILHRVDKKAIAKVDTAGAVIYGTYKASTCMRKLHGACRELGLNVSEYLRPKADGTLSPLGQEFRSSITRYLIQNDSLGQQITEAERITPRDTELDDMLTEAHRIMEMHAEELALQMAVRREEERQLAQIAPVERLAVAMSLHQSVA